LRLARALGLRIGAHKIVYYISPQVWAWNRGRIKKMARFLDLMLCIFPFEADLYNQSGLRTVFVGHPMIERLRACKVDIERDPNLVAFFPGSRSREVRKIFPILIEAAYKLRRRKPNLRFEVAAASDELVHEMEEILNRSASGGRDRQRSRREPSDVDGKREELTGGKRDNQSFEIRTGEAATIMQRACAGIVASGSATLEAAYFRLPFVLIYKVAWPTYLAARLVVSVKYLGMPNVLANKEVVPEFIQPRAKGRAIANAVLRLIDESSTREQMISEFDAIIAKLGEGGASDRAANAIINELG
jgi:lipid-A-disaccharide synthase